MTEKTEATKSITLVNKEITKELSDPGIVRALLATTFKGLSEPSMKQAIFEGMIRGLKFKDFLEKNVYAIPYGQSYSLVTSIDHARKIGMRSGVIGKSAPDFVMYTNDQGKESIESCSITIKRRVGQDIGEYTATVYFDEYDTGRNQWTSKPRTMIAKVAEMHALRMACPEELSQTYTAEEFDKSKEDVFDTDGITDDTVPTVHVGDDHGAPGANLILDRTSTQKEEQEIPADEESQINLILALVAKKWPGTDLKDQKGLKTKVHDYTGLEYTASNYPTIIKMLR